LNDEEKRHKAEALARKKQFNVKNGFDKDNHFDFQGRILKYHQWISLSVGTLFMLLALLHQRGSFLYFYVFGLVKVAKDTLETYLETGNKELSPLIFYLFGGLTVLILMTQNGYPVPDMTYGLLSNTAQVIP